LILIDIFKFMGILILQKWRECHNVLNQGISILIAHAKCGKSWKLNLYSKFYLKSSMSANIWVFGIVFNPLHAKYHEC